MYLNVATAMLFSMACLTALPALFFDRTVRLSGGGVTLAVVTLVCGFVVLLVSITKTFAFSFPGRQLDGNAPEPSRMQGPDYAASPSVCILINCVAWASCLVFPGFWLEMCRVGGPPTSTYTGLFFCYRCINPGSGISPLVPILLLMLGWYVWAFFQARRLPLASNEENDHRFYISDEELCGVEAPRRYALVGNITCLFITRESLRFAIKSPHRLARIGLDVALLVVYLGGLTYFSVFDPIRSLNHVFWTHRQIADPYEFLMGLLFFPLIMVSLAGWLRGILVWTALRNGLLERLENMPIRLGFSRLKGFGWMGMLRQSGIHEQWRDVARSVESMRSVMHEEDMKARISPADWEEFDRAHLTLEAIHCELRERIAGTTNHSEHVDYMLINKLEREFSNLGNLLFTRLLIPYWQTERTGLVNGAEVEELPMKARRWEMRGEIPNLPIALRATPEPADPPSVFAAEEFLAIRYVALIRAVLANMRSLMLFVSIAFVLCIVAWHSYPFQPRQQVDWLCTGLLVILGTGIVWVFAQMYRDPILSRITDTQPNELGWEFYFRIVAFGAVPALTWLAYQFPDIGSTVFKLFQPAVDFMK
jgi:hypothetical protein